MMQTLYRLLPEYWTIDSNTAMSASVVSTADDALLVTLAFRGTSDFAGMMFSSLDANWHQFFKYAQSTDYADTVLAFNATFSAPVSGKGVAPFSDQTQRPVMSVKYVNGEEKFVMLGLLSETDTATDTFEDYTYTDGAEEANQVTLSHQWGRWHSATVTFTPSGGSARTLTEGDEYFLEYVEGWIEAYVEGETGTLEVTYEYGLHERYVIDFNELYDSHHPDYAEHLSSSGIESVSIGFVPLDYVESDAEGGNEIRGETIDATVALTAWEVTGAGAGVGFVMKARDANGYQVADGYDDEYHRNPKRLVDTLYALGYRGRFTLYTGASHFYEKTGTLGDPAEETVDDVWTQRFTADATKGLNAPAATWWRYFLKAAKDKFEVVCSVSLELLHMPDAWAQMTAEIDGVAHRGQTGWVPPTSFYSVTNADVRTYVSGYVREFLDIMVEEGHTPILQMGEPWIWVQEGEPGGGYGEGAESGWWDTTPPCYYDAATKAAYLAEFGTAMPEWTTTDIEQTVENRAVAEWLRDQLADYIITMRDVAKEYEDGQFTVLFFPPSVLDPSRTTWLVQKVNYPMSALGVDVCDFIQIEAYDWVMYPTPENQVLLAESYTFMQDEFGYTNDKVDYFAGFAWTDNIPLYWARINDSAQAAKAVGVAVTIWAGVEILRDSWFPNATNGRGCIEFMTPAFDQQDAADAIFLDSSLTYDGAPATVITGLDHLEGQEVAILGDGAVLPSQAVTGGQITLSTACSVVHVGLAYTSLCQTLQVETGGDDGTAQGKAKRITKATARVLRSASFKVGKDESSLVAIPMRSAADPMGAPTPLYTGDVSLPVKGGFDREGKIMLVQDSPVPTTVLAVVQEVQVNAL